jgi:hypothetical protein
LLAKEVLFTTAVRARKHVETVHHLIGDDHGVLFGDNQLRAFLTDEVGLIGGHRAARGPCGNWGILFNERVDGSA